MLFNQRRPAAFGFCLIIGFSGGPPFGNFALYFAIAHAEDNAVDSAVFRQGKNVPALQPVIGRVDEILLDRRSGQDAADSNFGFGRDQRGGEITPMFQGAE